MRRQWNNILKVLKGYLLTKISTSPAIVFQNKSEIKTFPDMKKQK